MNNYTVPDSIVFHHQYSKSESTRKLTDEIDALIDVLTLTNRTLR